MALKSGNNIQRVSFSERTPREGGEDLCEFRAKLPGDHCIDERVHGSLYTRQHHSRGLQLQQRLGKKYGLKYELLERILYKLNVEVLYLLTMIWK